MLVLVFGWVHVNGGRTSARVGRSDSQWDSNLRSLRLNLRVQVAHRSLSPRRLRIRGCAGVSGWYLSDRVSEWVSKRVG